MSYLAALGRIPKRLNFWKNSKRPLTPPPHFWKIILQFFIMDMVAFMQGDIGQIVSVNINSYQLISIQLLKTYPEP